MAVRTASVKEGSDLSGLIALLIENDEDLRGALTFTMEGWGLDVLACAGEDEATALLGEIGVAPDVIIADMQLDADREGAAAIRALRARHGPLPACLISAARGPEPIAAARDLGVPLLHKPINPETLRSFLAGVGQSQTPAGG